MGKWGYDRTLLSISCARLTEKNTRLNSNVPKEDFVIGRCMGNKQVHDLQDPKFNPVSEAACWDDLRDLYIMIDIWTATM